MLLKNNRSFIFSGVKFWVLYVDIVPLLPRRPYSSEHAPE